MRTLIALVGLLAFGVDTARPMMLAAPQEAPTKVCTLKITGMTCAGCATAVKLVAKKLSGVKDATVSYEQGLAEITYEPAKTTPDAIAKQITEKAGFKASVQNRK